MHVTNGCTRTGGTASTDTAEFHTAGIVPSWLGANCASIHRKE